jgi:soluble lytic murein transglycosylase
MEGVMVLPPPKCLVERAVRAMATPPGGLTDIQLEVTAADAAVMPGLRERVMLELEKLLYTPGPRWEAAFEAMGAEGAEADLLLARRLAAVDAGRRRLEGLLDAGGEAAAVAAAELLERWPHRYSRSWRLADLLCGSDRVGLAAGMGGPGTEFGAGLRMALLRADGEYRRLLSLCDSVLSAEGAADSLRARAMLFRARAHRALRESDAAYSAYTALAVAYPGHPTSREGAYLAGKYFDSEQDWPRAADAYLASLRSEGTWEGDSRAHWRGGFCLYMSGRGAVGDSLWRAGIESHPRSYWRDEMLFWRARYAARRGRRSSSRRLLSQVAEEHPWEFYGMLARRRLDLAAPPTPAPLETPVAGTPEGELAAEMMELGYGAALPGMLGEGSTGDPMVRARVLALLGETRAAMTLMRRIDTGLREEGTGMLPDGMLPFYFPDPYGSLAGRVAAGLSLEASVLQGIMREESYFDRWVVSWAGARGLIQLMPGTAGDVARWYGLPRLSEEEFWVPENSVRYGALYINRQYESFGGVQPLYLAAYNAGPGNARRWVDMHGWDPGDPELYIEQITYRETRMYVKKVLRSAWIYEGRQP